MKHEIYLTKEELQDIIDLMGKFDIERIRLEWDNSSGIGYNLDAVIETKIFDTFGEFKVTVTDESSW